MNKWPSEAAIAYDELQQQCARFRALNADLLAALEKARHSLVTLNGLSATDGFGAYSVAQRVGADSNGAWDYFVEQCFRIDETTIIREIDATIARAEEETT